MPRPPTLIILLLGLLASIASAWSAPTFCKCTCFTNNTIIPLGPDHPPQPPSNPSPPSDDEPQKPDILHHQTRSDDADFLASTTTAALTSSQEDDDNELAKNNPTNKPSELSRRSSSTSCSQCNRAFCLSYNLPICKDAEEKDVQTMCFQRDSRKDQIIVWGFILGTAGLLGWAGIKRALEMREIRGRFLGGLGGGGGGGGGSGGDRGAYRPVGADGTPRDSVSG